MIREADVETYLRDEVKKRGGKCYKVVVLGEVGHCDRHIYLPGGIFAQAELKKPGKKPEPHQKRRHKLMRRLGVKVYGCIDSHAAVDKMLKELDP